jgi:hypothetical protein
LIDELLDGLRVNLNVVVWCLKRSTRVLLYPKILWGLEIIAEDRNDLLNLFVRVLIYEEDKCRLPASFIQVGHDVLILKPASNGVVIVHHPLALLFGTNFFRG